MLHCQTCKVIFSATLSNEFAIHQEFEAGRFNVQLKRMEILSIPNQQFHKLMCEEILNLFYRTFPPERKAR